MYPKFQLQEEEEGGGGLGGCYFKQIPRNINELAVWWKHVTKGIEYPLFGLFLASESDKDVISLVNDSRDEIKIISGHECCIIYFRDEEKAVSGNKWCFSEHAKAAVPLGQLLRIRAPAIVFFEDITSNCFATISLDHLTSYDQLLLLRSVFQSFYQQPDAPPLQKIKKVSRNIHLKKLAKGLLGKTSASATEFLRQLENRVRASGANVRFHSDPVPRSGLRHTGQSVVARHGSGEA